MSLGPVLEDNFGVSIQPFQVGKTENFKVFQLEMVVTWSILELATSFWYSRCALMC